MRAKKIVKDKYIRTRVTKERLEEIKKYCTDNDTTVSELINGFFDKLLEK